MHLIVTVPSGEYEARNDLGVVADEAAADALLAAHAGEWYEATLCPPRADPERDAWRPQRRRFPASTWREVAHWRETERTHPFGRLDEIVAWLRAGGCTVTWESLRAAGPWAGRQNRYPGSVEPDHELRVAERDGHDALDAALCLVLREGATAEAVEHERSSQCVARATEAHEERERHRTALREAHNVARRLRGEPEVTAEQERAEEFASAREWTEKRKAKRHDGALHDPEAVKGGTSR